jgi:hypothetical protein
MSIVYISQQGFLKTTVGSIEMHTSLKHIVSVSFDMDMLQVSVFTKDGRTLSFFTNENQYMKIILSIGLTHK